MPPSGFHHVEIWVADLALVEPSWNWILGELGWELYQNWPAGRSWRVGESYLVVEQSSAVRPGLPYDRMRPGLNHLAVHAPDRTTVDRIHAAAEANGWQPLFAEKYPHAGGPDHYAAYLTDAAGFEIEVVAPEERGPDVEG
ncbi:VOC family protein [Catenulispora rubra]|uniref:VOC family protein n=1 Tax=Catenulispora rubra TaxID=280293 RepID=UPI0018927EDB|nr:VOC family protein [Catenulispora rubra]